MAYLSIGLLISTSCWHFILAAEKIVKQAKAENRDISPEDNKFVKFAQTYNTFGKQFGVFLLVIIGWFPTILSIIADFFIENSTKIK